MNENEFITYTISRSLGNKRERKISKGENHEADKKIDFLYSDQDFLGIEFNFMKKVEKEVKETEKKDNSNYLSVYPLFTKETFRINIRAL